MTLHALHPVHQVRLVLRLIIEPSLEESPKERMMLVHLLENLSSNDDNRRHLYKAERLIRHTRHTRHTCHNTIHT